MTREPAAVSAEDLRRLLATRHAAFRAALRAAERSVAAGPVHKTRVAARSLRSLLATLRPLLRPRLQARARRDLRSIALELEEVRAADVRREWLAALAADSGVLAPGAFRQLDLELRRDLVAARERLRAHLRSAASRERASRLAATLADVRLVQDVGGDIGNAVRARLRSRWKRLRRALRSRPTEPQALHELRLAAKHARYATEALAPLLQLDPRLKLRMLKRLQDCLGEHRDAGEALHWLDRLGEPFGPVLKSRLAGPIAKVQARHMRELDRLACRFEMPRL